MLEGSQDPASWQPLSSAFFRPSARLVAPKLLGHWLLRRTPRGVAGGLIVETEAYLSHDPACHAFKGPTARNASMFSRPGLAYVYLIYGLHHCVNVVCQPEGCGEAILIRAIGAELGLEVMQRRRATRDPHQLTNGPAKLCQALDIDRQLDGVDLCRADSPLWIAENPQRGRRVEAEGPIERGPRIGITQAADLPLRFCLSRSPWLSRPVRTTSGGTVS